LDILEYTVKGKQTLVRVLNPVALNIGGSTLTYTCSGLYLIEFFNVAVKEMIKNAIVRKC